MPDNHRGTPIAGNHRPTPRLAKKLSNHYDLGYGETQKRLDNYRTLRDNPSNTYDMFDSFNTADDIREGLGQPRKDFYQHYEDRGEMDKVNAMTRDNEDNTPYQYRGYGNYNMGVDFR